MDLWSHSCVCSTPLQEEVTHCRKMTRLRDLSTYCVLKAYKVWTSGPSPSEWQVQLGWGERRRSNPRPSWNASPGMKTVTHIYKLFETNHVDLYKILLNRIDLVNSSLYYQL